MEVIGEKPYRELHSCFIIVMEYCRIGSGVFEDGTSCDSREMSGRTGSVSEFRTLKSEFDITSDKVDLGIIIVKEGSTENNIGRYRSD